MTVEKRDCLAPSAIETPRGDLGDQSTSGPRLSTHGALGDESAHGDLAGYRAKQAQYGSVHQDGGAGGIGVGQPCGLSTTGQVNADSNVQSTGVAGGEYADHSLVIRKGGADTDGLRDSNLGAGGRSIA